MQCSYLLIEHIQTDLIFRDRAKRAYDCNNMC